MTTCEPVSIYDTAALDRLRAQHRLDPRVLRKLKTALFKKWLPMEEGLLEVPEPARAAFARQLSDPLLTLDQRIDSADDGATKLLFCNREGLPFESVLMRAGTGRTTLCISSQVGCAAGCKFCATGKMDVVRDLAVGEILDQVRQAGIVAAAEDRRVRNIVFMGMGEPLFNEEVVAQAIDKLTSPDYYHHSAKRILLSTVGVPEAMVRIARKFPEVNLALSLHTVDQELRQQLMPPARRWPLDMLRKTVEILNQIQQQPVMIEYLMLAGLNDSDANAHQLSAWLEGLRVHVNLIPYNPIEGRSDTIEPTLIRSSRQVRDQFATHLRQAGFQTTIRYSLGTDISAACGQLAGK